MKKLSIFAAPLFAIALTGFAQAGEPIYIAPEVVAPPPMKQPRIPLVNILSYDYIEAGWNHNELDVPGFDDSVDGFYIDLSVSLDDNAYIALSGVFQDDASAAAAGIGLHHELFSSFDLTAEVGGLYEEVFDDLGGYGEFGARWAVFSHLELGASVGAEWIDSDTEVYGIVRVVVPITRALSVVAAGRVEDEDTEVRFGFRFDF
jgi:hypothetical protein